MSSPLNDLSRPIRSAILIQGAGLGLMAGGLVAASEGRSVLVAGLLLGGVLVVITGMGALFVWVGRADRLLRREVETGGAELAAGGLSGGEVVPARVVRRRVARRSPSYSTASPDPQPAPSVLLVATALTDTGPRRVAALVPALTGLESRHAPLLLRLHATRTDVAILDTRASPAQVDQADRDPRWGTERLPTDSSVAGGRLAQLGTAAVGVVIGLVIALALTGLTG